MLPTATKFTEEFRGALMQYVSNRSRGGALEATTQTIIHEGARWRIVRPDGSISESELKEASHFVTIPQESAGAVDFAESIRMATEVADSFQKSASQDLLKALDDGLPDSQRAGGEIRPFDIEHFFEALEKIQMDFDENGEPEELSMMIHPDVAPRIAKIAEEFEASPELQARHEAIIRKKFEEYREREARRRLVG